MAAVNKRLKIPGLSFQIASFKGLLKSAGKNKITQFAFLHQLEATCFLLITSVTYIVYGAYTEL